MTAITPTTPGRLEAGRVFCRALVATCDRCQAQRRFVGTVDDLPDRALVLGQLASAGWREVAGVWVCAACGRDSWR